MRICLIQDFFPPFFTGGASVYVGALAEALQQQGHQVTVITTGPTSQQLITEERRQGIQVFSIDTGAINNPVYTGHETMLGKMWSAVAYWLNPKVARAITGILEETKPDVIHTNDTLYLSLSALAVARRSKIPWVHTVHYLHLVKPTGLRWSPGQARPSIGPWAAFLPFTRAIVGSPACVVGPSQFSLDVHHRYRLFPKSAQEVIPHGVLHKNIKTRPRNGPARKFLFLGRLSDDKGLRTLLDAWSGITNPELELTVCGDGPLRSIVEQAASQDGRIKVLPPRTSSELAAVYDQADVFVAPSLAYETFNLTLIEAMQSGLPLIASAIGAQPEIVDPSVGQLVPPGQSKELRSAILQAAGAQEMNRKWSEQSSKKSINYTFDRHLASLVAVYRRLVGVSAS